MGQSPLFRKRSKLFGARIKHFLLGCVQRELDLYKIQAAKLYDKCRSSLVLLHRLKNEHGSALYAIEKVVSSLFSDLFLPEETDHLLDKLYASCLNKSDEAVCDLSMKLYKQATQNLLDLLVGIVRSQRINFCEISSLDLPRCLFQRGLTKRRVGY